MSLGFDKEGKLHELDYSLRTELQDVGTILNLAEYKTRMAKKFMSRNTQANFFHNTSQENGIEVQHFASVPISNFIKVYAQLDGVISNLRSMSVREVEKSTRHFLRNNYLEPI